jgi:hypothetical protein
VKLPDADGVLQTVDPTIADDSIPILARTDAWHGRPVQEINSTKISQDGKFSHGRDRPRAVAMPALTMNLDIRLGRHVLSTFQQKCHRSRQHDDAQSMTPGTRAWRKPPIATKNRDNLTDFPDRAAQQSFAWQCGDRNF